MRRRTIVAAIAGLLLAIAGLWAVVYLQPVLDDDEVAAIGRETARKLERGRAERCPRGVLRGTALPGSGRDALAAVLDVTGAHATCWSFLDANIDAVREPLQAPDAEALPADPHADDPPPPGEPPVADPWDHISPGGLFPGAGDEIETRTLAACGDTVTALRRALRHEDVCSPIGYALPDMQLTGAVRITWVLALEARREIRAGRLQPGIESLLDALRFGSDLGRGPTNLVSAMLGTAVTRIAVGQLEMALAQDLGWDEPTLRALQRQLEVVVRTLPPSDRVVREDSWSTLTWALVSLGWTPPHPLPDLGPPPEQEGAPPGHDARLQLVYSLRENARALAANRCRAEDTREACFARLLRAAPPARTSDDWSWRMWALGPRSVRSSLHADLRAATFPRLPPYALRIERTQAAVRALWAVLEHRRRTLGTSTCPTAAELATMVGPIPTERGLGGRFTFHQAPTTYRPIEVSAPDWLRPPEDTRPRLNLPVARAYCPMLPRAQGSGGAP